MDKLRLGGMALSNGVLVHGPTSWGAAVRASDGSIKSASGVKRRFAPNVTTPFVRGPLRLAEAFAVLPDVRRALPEARFPFERPRVAVAVVAGAAAAGIARRSQLGFLGKEAVAAFASLAPAVIALRGGDLASYHGAEHISIGTYETGEPATKEHDRCGGHLVGPLLLTSAAASALAARAPVSARPAARALGAVGAMGAAVEIFGWMGRHPEQPLSRALARPGHILQTRVSTAEPSAAQLEVAEAALSACLEGRRAGVTQAQVRGERLDPDVFDLPVEKMREGYYTDAYFNHTRSTLLADGRHPRVLMQVFQRHTAMLGGMDEAIAVLKLCSDDWDGLEVFALYDGDTIEPWETVMTIEGDYTLFGHLETVYLGVLARRTLISTNTERVLRAANGKPIIFMAARHDHHRVQTGDGYAAYVAGAIRGSEIGVTSDAQASWWGGRGVGTVPHCADRRVRRRHGARRDRSSPSGRPTTSGSRCSSTSRTTRSRRRWPSRRRSARSSGAFGSTPRASSSTARSGRRWATSIREASTSASSARSGPRSTAPATSRCGSSPRAGSRSRRSRSSSAAAFRSTPTAWARR